MLDIRFIVENQEYVKKALSNRNGNYDIDAAVNLYNRRKEILVNVENKKAIRNKVSQEISRLKRDKQPCDVLIKNMQELGDEIKDLDSELSKVEEDLRLALLYIPNLPDESVPIGADESFNQEIRRWGNPTTFEFEPKPHWEIGENLNILDFSSASKITGARFTVYKGLGARLERALINFMLDCHIAEGYTEIMPPYMVNRDSMTGTGQLPKFEEDAFLVNGTNYFLVPTAEVPVTNLFRGDILNPEQLPIKYCAYTACFRAEAGSAGRDTRGLIRQHQFNKVELVKFCRPDQSMDELESLTNNAEMILQKLGLPYRVVLLSTGDMGFSSAKTYDLEVWMPSYGKYVEISSCSNFKDYQARRMNIRFKENGKTTFVHTLNGSGIAVGRTTAAILENFQNKDGSVTIPKVLIPYMGVETIR